MTAHNDCGGEGDARRATPESPTWSIRAGMRVWVGGNNVDVRRAVAPLLNATVHPPDGVLDAAVLTPLTGEEACYFLRKTADRLGPGAHVWVVERSDAGASSVRPAVDASAESLGFSFLGTVHPGPRIAAHGYRRNG